MTYQTMENANDGMPLLREKGSAVDVVEEGSIDEIDGSSTGTSRRSRKGAALGLIVLTLGAVSALSALGGKPSSQSECRLVVCVVQQRFVTGEHFASPKKYDHALGFT